MYFKNEEREWTIVVVCKKREANIKIKNFFFNEMQYKIDNLI